MNLGRERSLGSVLGMWSLCQVHSDFPESLAIPSSEACRAQQAVPMRMAPGAKKIIIPPLAWFLFPAFDIDVDTEYVSAKRGTTTGM